MPVLDWPWAVQGIFWIATMSIAGWGAGLAIDQIKLSRRRR